MDTSSDKPNPYTPQDALLLLELAGYPVPYELRPQFIDTYERNKKLNDYLQECSNPPMKPIGPPWLDFVLGTIVAHAKVLPKIAFDGTPGPLMCNQVGDAIREKGIGKLLSEGQSLESIARKLSPNH